MLCYKIIFIPEIQATLGRAGMSLILVHLPLFNLGNPNKNCNSNSYQIGPLTLSFSKNCNLQPTKKATFDVIQPKKENSNR